MDNNDSCKKEYRAQNLVIGGGIAGIVTALELLDGGQSVILLDADTQDRFGELQADEHWPHAWAKCYA